MKLAKIQKEFANHIYNKSDLEIFSKINDSNIAQADRLNIYRNNIFGNFENALSLTYKITKKIVGEEYFLKLISNYCQDYRSNSGNLEDFGQFFPELIEKLESEHKLFYLADIAQLEWLFNLAYFAVDAPDLDVEKLQKLDEDDLMPLVFGLHPSCYLMASKYPIYSIWAANIKDDKGEIDLAQKKGEFIVIERSGLRPNIHQITNIEYDFLVMIKNQLNLYQIYEILAEKQQEFAKEFDIGSLINKFISLRIITTFHIKNDKS